MSRRIRPSARKKTWHNVMCSALSETDKKCIEEVFEKFEYQKEQIEGLIAGQETLQKALAEKAAEVERLNDNLINKCIYLSDNETTEYCVDGPCPNFKTEAEIKAEAIKEFTEKLCEGRVPNDPVVIAVKVELKMMADAKNATTTEKRKNNAQNI